MPGVKVGNNSWIGAGLIIEKDVPADSIASLKVPSLKIERKP
jgi:acetyltransferase-like isoleucine patch superfamily enzyme